MSATAKATPERDSVAGEIATAVKQSFVYGLSSIVSKVFAFLLLPLYTHYLSPQDYGVFEVLELSMSLLGMFLSMGITAALLRFYGSADTEEQKRKVVGSLFLFAVAVSAVAFLAVAPVIRPLTTLLLGPEVPSVFFILSFVGFLIAYVANVPDTTLRAKGLAATVATIDTLSTVGLLLLNVLLIAVLMTSLFGMFLGRVIVSGVNLVVLFRWTSREVLGGMDWKLLRSAIVFGSPLVLSNLSMFVLNFSDRFVLQKLESLAVVGIYGVGYKFGYLLSALVIWPFFMTWHARMYVIYKRSDHEKVFARVFVLYSAALTFVGVGMSVFGSEVMRFMVDFRYAAAVTVIPVVSFAYILLGVGYYVQVGLYLKSRTGLIGSITAVAAGCNLVATYLLVRAFGMIGAAWATVLGFLVIAVGSYIYAQRVCPLDLPVGRVTRTLAIGLGVYVLSSVLPSSGLAVDVLVKTLLMFSFPVLLWLGGCFSSDDIATLRSLRTGALRQVKPAWTGLTRV